ncbi:MAG: hypothetical protein KA085_02510 [Phenylobacterium sp.]|uniref:hypothetical protein n=1 Tax=Phenylobacterium sp. TaxID=1871053 RepID=UPI001B72BFE3|nr:hypothetical protein [Phenylobacterium sp.]MBP7814970.1 hypothetical protein [Phenylobacterium sp.]MBP9230081.1 hypothetical protein [Phenylobacterium sp.]MBP9755026.1 hypothetical protein [Phenylobacterium sp.]
MEDLFRGYWWLIFPLGGFVFAAWDRWLSYQRSRDTLELIKTYSAQGKDVPPELLRHVQDDAFEDDDRDDYRGRRGRRAYRRYDRHGSYWQFRSAIYTGAIAAAFWVASEYAFVPGTVGPFRVVAVVLTCVAAANLALALLASASRRK